MSGPGVVARVLGAVALVALSGAGLAGVAGAADGTGGSIPSRIPTGGADPDTPGTGSSVSPRTVAPGATISFRVTGFPAGEVVYVKIDDGSFCSQSGVHGACVVHQQRIPASGPVTGSLQVPSDLPAGRHWLRFLASQEVRDAQGGYVGVKGYTLRGGSTFTVVDRTAPSGDSPGSSTAPTPTAGSTETAVPTDGPVPGTAVPTDGAGAGATLSVAPPTGAAAATGPSATLTLAPPPASAATGVAEATPAETRFPYVGLVGGTTLCALAGLVLLRGRRHRG